MRRTWLRGFEKVSNRYSLAAAAHNLGRILRRLFGIGKPMGLQGHNGLCTLAQNVIERLMARMMRDPGRIEFSQLARAA
jgi:hypothetical protein